MTDPVIYLSSNKHHQYFNNYNDGKDSYYSNRGCKDNLDDLEFCILTDIRSFHARDSKQPLFNNAGEPESHPEVSFINSPETFYPNLVVNNVWDMVNKFCG